MAEDRHAWANPGVEQVTETVHRIPLPLPLGDVLRAVNIYVVQGPDGVALVDAGWNMPEALDALEAGLGSIGIGLGDLSLVLATHFHPDHFTLGVLLRRRVGVPVYLGEGDRDTVEGMMDNNRGHHEFPARLVRCGIPLSFIDENLIMIGRGGDYELPNRWLQDNDAPDVGGRVLTAISTPGHTRGHFCFADDAAGLLFAGDHVLPHITPSIGFERAAKHLPLGDYLDSLRRVRERPDAMLLPAHGPVTSSVHTRIDQILEHHEVRLGQTERAVNAGACTAWEVAHRIPWTRRNLELNGLHGMDQIMATQETLAHLAVLEQQGRVRTVVGAEVDEWFPA